ncbi:MAG: hypothetical protein HUU22_06450 [Phycisphaerae bacterium]|nr:hypothetical protein [Phycisphaerae bacterium]NUQ45654.1 hypothetical protein [Phycisphaerae bacterium]
MNEHIEIERYAGVIRNMQLISGAMLMGVVVFLIVALVRPADQVGVDAGGAAPGGKFSLVYLSVAFGVVALGASMAVPRLMGGVMTKRQAMEDNAARAGGAAGRADRIVRLLAVRNATMIVQVGILEGTALFAVTAYFIERSSWSLVVAIVLAAAIAARIPTKAGLRDWLELTLREQDAAGRWN